MADLDKTTYLPSEMAEEIRGIKRSLSDMQEIHGIDSSEHSVHFYDYDGSLLYSYSPSAFLLMDEMPPNPVHEGLIAQGWNWSLEDAKEYVAEHRALTVGQMYTTSDGKTRIYVRIDKTVEEHMLERNTHFSEYGWIDYLHGSTSPGSYGQYKPDADFYNFYLDLSFWYEDDGEEHFWAEFPKCAIIDWGDGSDPDDVWINTAEPISAGGNSGYYTPIIYNEQNFRYWHRYGSGDKAYAEYVISIEILDKCWRGRLSFSLSNFDEDAHDRYDFGYAHRVTVVKANAPQYIQKIEVGDNMDLASHPDILRDGSYYYVNLDANFRFQVDPFVGEATISFPASDLVPDGVDNEGYLYVQVAFSKRDQYQYTDVPFDFDAALLEIDADVAVANEYSLDPLASFSDDELSAYMPLSMYDIYDFGWGTSIAGHVIKSKAYRHAVSNKYHYSNRIFEIARRLPPTIGIDISYPIDVDSDQFQIVMALSVAWIPKDEIQYSEDNYLYNLESITLPKGLKSLGSVCFKNCYSLRHVAIPDGITEIPCGVFANDFSLTSLSLPNSTKTLGIQALHGCRKLSDVSFPDTISSIGAGAFDGCDSLSKIANVEGIEQWVNYQDEEETTVVPEDIFSGCTDITEVSIPETTTKISARAFKNCSSLQTVNIPSTVEEIGDEAFCGCTSIIGGEGSFFGRFGEVNPIANPHKPLRIIGKSAFKGCRLLTEIVFPSNLQALPESVCEDCQSLLSVTISTYVKSVGNRAFHDCKSLINVYFRSNGVYEIGDYAFSGCRFATFVTYAGSNKVLPERLEKIGKRAFEKTSLRSVVIPFAITEINEGTFSECKLLESVEFIRDSDWYTLSHGETVFRIEKIGPYAFYSTLLTSISFPDSVTIIGEYAFADCWRLENVTLPSNLEEIAGHVFESTHIKSIQLPNSITKIGDYAFSDCGALSSINIPDNVISIGEGAFMNAGHLASITLPASVRSIGDYAFAVDYDEYPSGSHLESITFLSKVPPAVEGTNAWQGLPTSCVIHVPMYRLDAYKSANNYPDPNVYTYVADQPDQRDNEVSVSGSELIITGPSVNMLDDSLNFTDNFASLNNDELTISS